MKTKKMPFHRYRPYPDVSVNDRHWPDNVIRKAPTWCSVDLRDGNQALPKPMLIEEKLEMFRLLTDIGFKEIEVAFPSASQIEFDFVRTLIDGGYIPEDVTIQVLTQAREHLIRRTFESLSGARRAVVHMYNSTSRTQREIVFRKDRAGIIKIAEDAASLMNELRRQIKGSDIQFEYSPESFTATETDFALEICHAVMDIWKPVKEDKIIINLPATVEMSSPNIYADRIESFIRNLKSRESVIISVHPHNDRGTAVAAAELAVMAGAERVEGALLGNGERTGNMDIMTMALNLFSQGVDPKLDFSNINNVRTIYEKCTKMRVDPRHPYAGELVYTAFSGSHQDAIKKGMEAQDASKDSVWDVPYLPIDPEDVGRDYQSIIRINSQSGKGGVAYIMEKEWGYSIPKDMQPDFAKIIQNTSESYGKELSSEEILDRFKRAYISQEGKYTLISCSINSYVKNKGTSVRATIKSGGNDVRMLSDGNGPLDAFVRGISQKLGIDIEVIMYEEHSMSSGADAEAAAYIGLRHNSDEIVFGAGVDSNISVASIKAVISAVNRIKAD